MRSHEIDCEIIGTGRRPVEVTLDPGETMAAEAGSTTAMETGIRFRTRTADGSNPDRSLFLRTVSCPG